MIKVKQASTKTNGFYKAISCRASTSQEAETIKRICPMWSARGLESNEGFLSADYRTERVYDRHGVAHNTCKITLRPISGLSISDFYSREIDQVRSEIKVTITRQKLNSKWRYSATVRFADQTGISNVDVIWYAKISKVNPSSLPVVQLSARALKEALKAL